MAYQRFIMTAHEDLVEKIENILKTDLDFLFKYITIIRSITFCIEGVSAITVEVAEQIF